MSTLKPWLNINNKREAPHANIWTFHSSTTWLIFIAHKDVLLCNIRQVAIMFWPTAVRTPLHHDPDVHGNVGTLFMFTHCIRVKHNMTWLFHEFTAEYTAVNKSTCQNRNFMSNYLIWPAVLPRTKDSSESQKHCVCSSIFAGWFYLHLKNKDKKRDS